MLAKTPTRMDYQLKYERIIAEYNSEKDRTTIEETFRRLIELVSSMDEEQKRATREGLGEEELALFDLLLKEGIDKAARERVKQASRELLAASKKRLADLAHFWEREQTKGEVEALILDHVYSGHPTPPFTEAEKALIAKNVYSPRLTTGCQRRVRNAYLNRRESSGRPSVFGWQKNSVVGKP